MIHQVKASEQNDSALFQLVSLQISLLEFAAKLPKASVTSMFADEHIESALSTHLSSNHAPEVAKKIAKWFSNKEKSFIIPLKAFAYQSKKSKMALLNDISHDIELLNAPKAESFRFALNGHLTKWESDIRDFLLAFYSFLSYETKKGTGFPEFFFTPTLDSKNFDRWILIKNFTAENEMLNLCVICDVSAYRTQVGDRIQTDLEHFFPKSIYPHLAIHPRNLVPICKYCNGIASDKDILSFVSTTGGLMDVLLPYQTETSGLRDLAFVKVTAQKKPYKHPLKIALEESSGSNSKTFVESFEKTYKVVERWNNDMEQIDSHVFRRIQQFFLSDVLFGNNLNNHEFVLKKLEMLMALTSLENLGQDPYGFVTVWFLYYHADELRKKGASSALLEGLKSWGDSKNEVFKRFEEHVKELVTRVS